MNTAPHRSRRTPTPAWWPALGILGLVLLNAAFDLARAGPSGLFDAGSFLHLEHRDGTLGGPLIDILSRSSKIVILALGMALVIAVRGVDLSVGSVMAVSGAVAATLVLSGVSGALAITAALGASALCGAWNAWLVTGLKLQPFVATLVLMVAGRGVAQMITGGQIATFHNTALEYVSSGRPAWIPLPFPALLTAAIALCTALTVRRSALGLLIEAVGGNPEAARLAGVRSGAVIGGAYVACSMGAGVAGLIAAADIKAADPFHAGLNLELAAIFSVVVGGGSLTGGRFSLRGACAGAVLMQTLTTTLYARNVSADVAPLPQALVILGVCLLASPRVRSSLRRRTKGRHADHSTSR